MNRRDRRGPICRDDKDRERRVETIAKIRRAEFYEAVNLCMDGNPGTRELIRIFVTVRDFSCSARLNVSDCRSEVERSNNPVIRYEIQSIQDHAACDTGRKWPNLLYGKLGATPLAGSAGLSGSQYRPKHCDGGFARQKCSATSAASST